MRRNAPAVTLVGLLVSSLALTACGASDPADDDPGAQQDDAATAPQEQFNEADVEYVSGMILHHEQAVEMSEILAEKDRVDADVDALAQEIRTAQQSEVQEMESWLEAWGHAEHDEHAEHGGGQGDHEDHGDHAGMMSEQDLEDLADAEGPEASRLFLEQMIVHHEGAVTSAQEHLEAGENPEALALSEDVIDDQSAEIEEMEQMLTDL